LPYCRSWYTGAFRLSGVLEFGTSQRPYSHLAATRKPSGSIKAIAIQMRIEIAKWVEQGRTDEEILDAYAKRYGAKVLVDPNTMPKGWTLVVPWAAASLGGLGAAWMLRRWCAARLAQIAPSDVGGGILPDIP
jgi:hypothetical protein